MHFIFSMQEEHLFSHEFLIEIDRDLFYPCFIDLLCVFIIKDLSRNDRNIKHLPRYFVISFSLSPRIPFLFHVDSYSLSSQKYMRESMKQ